MCCVHKAELDGQAVIIDRLQVSPTRALQTDIQC